MFDPVPFLPYFNVNFFTAAIAGQGAKLVVQANPNRVGLFIQADLTASINLQPATRANAGTPAFLIPANGLLELYWAKHGFLSTLDWWAYGPSPSYSANACVTELIWRPSQGAY